MKRREFIMLLGNAAAAWPLAARAQQAERMPRLGVLMGLPANDPGGPSEAAALNEGLRALGWIEGRNRCAGPLCYSMHSSACASSVGVTSSPSASAVFSRPPRAIK
jgi:hypothetical protein